MKKSLLFIAAAAAMLAGCAKTEVSVPETIPGTKTITIKATAEGIDTKVSFANDKTFGWQADDEIGLYAYDHATSTAGNINATFNGTPGDKNGSFSFTLGEQEDYYKVAWYPWVYAGGAWVQDAGNINEGTFTFDLYSEINITSLDALEVLNMPMLAYFPDDADKGSLNFKNVGALVKVSLKNVPSGARYFKLVSDTQVSGPCDIALTEANASNPDAWALTPVTGKGSTCVEIRITQDGVTPASETTLYFPVFTGDHKFGFEVYDKDGKTLYKKEITSTSTTNTLTRGTILQMPEIDIDDYVATSAYGMTGAFYQDETLISWGVNVPLYAVEGNAGWFVAKNIKNADDGLIDLKFWKDNSWDKEVGASVEINKTVNRNFFLIQRELGEYDGSGHDIIIGGGPYDIYFNETSMQAFFLDAGSAFAVPSADETNHSAYSVIGGFDYGGANHNWNCDIPMFKVGETDWYVAENVATTGTLDFKFRKDKDWAYEVGAARGSRKTLAQLFPLGQRALSQTEFDILVDGSGAYDIYFNETIMKAFVLTAGAAFTVPVDEEPAPTEFVKFYIDDQSGTSDPLYVWGWNGMVSVVSGSWPTGALALTETEEYDSKTWYIFSVAADEVKGKDCGFLIMSVDGGTVKWQSADCNFTADATSMAYFFTLNADKSITQL